MAPSITLQQKYKILWPLIIFVAAFSICGIIYIANIKSQFILDDQANLQPLDALNNGQLSLYEFLRVNGSGPTGRPASMFTFAMQAGAWPDKPENFKRVNLLIHLGNGLLVLWLLNQIGSALGLESRKKFTIACLATTLWLVHPIHTTSVLYTIQRMNLLSGFFALIALNTYTYARLKNSFKAAMGPTVLWGVLVTIAAALSILSKENGILTFAYLLALEVCVFHKIATERKWQFIVLTFTAIPIVLLMGYLISNYSNFQFGYQYREFTMEQRLLTQPRILFQYLHAILIPIPENYGLFQDDIDISTNLLTPLTTLISIVSWLVLVYIAIKYRYKYSVLSCAILWFLGGHLLESSVLPLESYFEHRNYLPSLFVLFSLTYLFHSIADARRSKRIMKPMVTGAAVIYVVSFIVSLNQVANLWSDPDAQAKTWLREHPNSPRAHEYLIHIALDKQDYKQAIAASDLMVRKWPNNGTILLKRIRLSCLHPDLKTYSIVEAANKLESALIVSASTTPLLQTVELHKAGHCQSISSEYLHSILSALEMNAQAMVGETGFRINAAFGIFHCARDELDKCLSYWDKAFEWKKRTRIALHQAEALIRNERYEEARGYLELAMKYLENSKAFQDQQLREIRVMEEILDRKHQ